MRDRVVRVLRCDLRVTGDQWEYARCNAREIDANWAERSTENPKLFNGTIHLITGHEVRDETLSARFLRTDFKSYLLWRESGFADTSVIDGFGSALIRSAEGHVLLGRQRQGNVNGGLTYLPGGFIDARDVTSNGRIDIERSIARELSEETGLTSKTVEHVPGYLLTFAGPLLSIAIEYRSPLPAEALKCKMMRHLAREAESELVDIAIIRRSADLDLLEMPAYARLLVTELYQHRG